jgi:predicted transposase/invertase (TIGR01784 family)
MKKLFLPLTDNFLFKVIFSKNEDLLLDLLNSFPEFQEEKKIQSLKVLNPELPKAEEIEKLSILDIHAEDISGNKFLLEMQSQTEKYFEKRILYYWSKLYSKSLSKGSKYKELKKIYSINFTEFNFLKTTKFHSLFHLREKTENEIILTDDLEIHVIELPKFQRELQKLNSEFESWIYALKKGHELKGEDMNTLTKKNPKLKKVFKEYKEYSSNPKNRNFLEARKKSILVYNTNMEAVKEEGKIEGELNKAFLISDELIKRGFPIEEVCIITGLSEKEILEYRKKNTTNKR